MQADRGEQLAHAQVAVFLRATAEAEGDVFFHREMRKEGVILEDHADAPLFRRQTLAGAADHLAMQADLAAGDFLEAGDAAQQGRLAAARRAEQAGDLAALEVEVDAIHHGMIAVTLDDAD